MIALALKAAVLVAESEVPVPAEVGSDRFDLSLQPSQGVMLLGVAPFGWVLLKYWKWKVAV